LRGALARNGQGRAGSARARCFALCLNGPQLGQGRSLCASPPVAACQVSPWGEPERFRRRSSALRAARRGAPSVAALAVVLAGTDRGSGQGEAAPGV